MINAPALLKALKTHLPKLEGDIRLRLAEVAEEEARLRGRYQEALTGGRTGATWEGWRDEQVTQAAVAWVLAGVYVRFLEDNGLIDQPWLSGPGERRGMAMDQRTLYFRNHPEHSDREFLFHVFTEVARFPAMGGLFDQRFNPLWQLAPSGDGAAALLAFWQEIDPASGVLRHDFTDPAWDTRFLGDLYQDLSEAVRKKFALLQTPEFVEQFILEKTLDPAMAEFGFQELRLIDPTCGSGHFLLTAFARLVALWQKQEPGTHGRVLVQRALDSVYGVDLNPYAVAIARFRLLVAALKFCAIRRLGDAPGFTIHLAAGDSLLHGPRHRKEGMMLKLGLFDDDPLSSVLATEDKEALREILGRQYHVVVGNPPYITPKDAVLNKAYRDRFVTCHRQYSLGVPFTERFFDLAIQGREKQPAGYVGMITANSFMKREFGTKLIETFFPQVDLDTVIDTSGAYIPGHGTPTVLLFGRHRPPVLSVVRTVQGIRGEPATPEDPAKGLVWSAIVVLLDQPGAKSAFISVVDTPRKTFGQHPWSLGGGGAAELKEQIDHSCRQFMEKIIHSVGFVCITKQDDVFCQPYSVLARNKLEKEYLRPFGLGEEIRDWNIEDGDWVIFPYNSEVETVPLENIPEIGRFIWNQRTILGDRKTFGGQTYFQAGKPWHEYGQIPVDRFHIPLSITFAFVATHNHFVLDRGGKVFNRSAPVIKLPAGASEADHLGLLGLLNSSVACFWMKQTFHNKGSTVDQQGARQTTIEFENFYEFTGTGLKSFPIPHEKPLTLATQLDHLAQARKSHLPAQIAHALPMSRAQLEHHRAEAERLLRQMIAGQEELDWRCYQLYGLMDADLTYPGAVPEIQLGERAFEIVLGRQMAEEGLETTWFQRHGSTPITTLPAHWPADYAALVERRIRLIAEHHALGLVEQPEYKRRWNLEGWAEQQSRSLRGWLLERLEALPLWKSDPPALTTCARLADHLHHDADFLAVATLYRGRADFDLTLLVKELVLDEAVPFLPVLRYKASGLRKRAAWEATWALQRQEDAGDAVGPIPVPPKYASADFLKTTTWRLRGGLDVPKERFIHYDYCEKGSDSTPVIGWAGWNPLQQAQAVAAYYLAMKENEGWEKDPLTPLLTGLLELLPWLKQWHNEIDPAFGLGLGDYFQGFFDEQRHSLGLTLDAIKDWKPPLRGRKRVSQTSVQPYGESVVVSKASEQSYGDASS